MSDWKDIAELARTLLVPMIGYIAWYIRDVKKTLDSMNKSIIELSAWAKQHEAADKDRFDAVKDDIDRLWNVKQSRDMFGPPFPKRND